MGTEAFETLKYLTGFLSHMKYPTHVSSFPFLLLSLSGVLSTIEHC